MVEWIKRLVVGRPLRSDRLSEQALSKRIALPIFASDPLSSVAYATQEILLVLTLGGLAYLFLAPWIGLAVVALLAVVVVSYRQVVRAYPSGGGSYEVASRNLGQSAGLDSPVPRASKNRTSCVFAMRGSRSSIQRSAPDSDPTPGPPTATTNVPCDAPAAGWIAQATSIDGWRGSVTS